MFPFLGIEPLMFPNFFRFGGNIRGILVYNELSNEFQSKIKIRLILLTIRSR